MARRFFRPGVLASMLLGGCAQSAIDTQLPTHMLAIPSLNALPQIHIGELEGCDASGGILKSIYHCAPPGTDLSQPNCSGANPPEDTEDCDYSEQDLKAYCDCATVGCWDGTRCAKGSVQEETEPI
jgi:hypothetical protein